MVYLKSVGRTCTTALVLDGSTACDWLHSALQHDRGAHSLSEERVRVPHAKEANCVAKKSRQQYIYFQCCGCGAEAKASLA
jgi:hypothetical protein